MYAFVFCLALAFFTSIQANGFPRRDKPYESQSSLRFLVLADWGGFPYRPYRSRIQVDVADQMAVTAEAENVSFILALGDNIYMNGVHSPLDLRFWTTFEEVYHHSSLQVPWYIIAGNHDYYGKVHAQILHSQFSERWIFPYYYYKVTKDIPGGATMDIVMLDTNILCGQVHLIDGIPKVGILTDRISAEEEWRWIEQTLIESQADFLLVVGHYPVYSVGSNGPTDCLIRRLEPLLYENHVTAYLSGHDHNLQHIQTTKGRQSMNFFITGSGAYVTPEQTNLDSIPGDSLKFFYGEKNGPGGFTFIDVSPTTMNIKFIDSSGTIRYGHLLSPRSYEN